MVSAVVKQRDMYRTLLAQSTPLPVESEQTMGSKVTTVTTPTKGVETGDMETTPTSQMDSEATQALKVHVHVHVHVQYASKKSCQYRLPFHRFQFRFPRRSVLPFYRSVHRFTVHRLPFRSPFCRFTVLPFQV